jgi:tetratricopeptide (TPR) repeat protein
MDQISRLPSPDNLVATPGAIRVLTATAGRDRAAVLAAWSAAATARGIATQFVDADFALGGPWAGLRDIFAALAPAIAARAPHLLVEHDYEIVTLLPPLRTKLAPRNPNLTDVSPELDQVRLYPGDRALRILHGLIDLLADWRDLGEGTPWLVVCDSFDRSSYLVRTFFAELMRRRGARCRLALVIACDPGEEAAVRDLFPTAQLAPTIYIDCAADAALVPDAAAQRRAAEAIELQVAADPDSIEGHLPSLIRLWQESDRPDRASFWQHRALTIYGFRGFYRDAVGYGEAALAIEEAKPDGDEKVRAWLVNLVVGCYWACGQPERSLPPLQRALVSLRSKFWRAKVRYLLAMVYARYLAEKDYDRAEAELDQAVVELQEADTTPQERCFEIAFNRNGLAFIRHRQGRFDEAIRLCREAHHELTEKLPQDKHMLHKSVLVYNQAQVYAALGESDKAFEHYTAVIDLDPNYAEYYNERGNVLLKMGHLDRALADYEKARTLSPPFPEVRTNLGHCYRLLGDLDRAVDAYTDALDLDAQQPKVLVVRAQCHEAAGREQAALADYDAALCLEPDQPLILANRACLLFQTGRTEPALADLDRAVELSPANPDLYRNRAVALAELGRLTSAIADLEACSRLSRTPADLEEVAQEILALRSRQGELSPASAHRELW